jgi:hypothetical protein
MIALPQPISGRECGECTVCCVALEINDPELQKPDDVVCQHMVPCQGCAIYAHRPRTCQTWMCGWRLIKLGDELRPDRSQILLIPEIGTSPGYEKGGLKLVFLGDRIPDTINDELLLLAARMVLGGVPLFLTHGSGKFAKRIIANDLLKPAANAGDKQGFINVIRSTLTRMADQISKEKAADGIF